MGKTRTEKSLFQDVKKILLELQVAASEDSMSKDKLRLYVLERVSKLQAKFESLRKEGAKSSAVDLLRGNSPQGNDCSSESSGNNSATTQNPGKKIQLSDTTSSDQSCESNGQDTKNGNKVRTNRGRQPQTNRNVNIKLNDSQVTKPWERKSKKSTIAPKDSAARNFNDVESGSESTRTSESMRKMTRALSNVASSSSENEGSNGRKRQRFDNGGFTQYSTSTDSQDTQPPASHQGVTDTANTTKSMVKDADQDPRIISNEGGYSVSINKDKKKIFICNYCNKQFTHRGNMNAHVRIHTG